MVANDALNEKVAKVIGYTQKQEGCWQNPDGEDIQELPDFSGNASFLVMRFFETRAQRQLGNTGIFESQYTEDLTSVEICNLALRILN